jgi:hypothetical protein
VDLITHSPDGRSWADPALVAGVRASLARRGVECADNRAYSLHPASMGARFAALYPERTLCFEVRRDLLVPAFTPFREMDVDPARAERMAASFADGLLAAWAAR